MTRLLVLILLFIGSVESKAKVPKVKLQLNASAISGGIIYSAGDRGSVLSSELNLGKYEMSEVSKAMLNDIYVDEKNILVVGHYNQILHKEKAQGSFKTIKLDLESDESFFNITKGDNQFLVSGSYGSVIILDEKFKPRFIRVVIDDELEPHIYGAIYVSKTEYILAGEKGLVLSFDSSNGKVKKLTTPVDSSIFGIDLLNIKGQKYLLVYGLLGNIYYTKYSPGSVNFSWSKVNTPNKNHINRALASQGSSILIGANAGYLYSYDILASELEVFKHPKGLGILDIEVDKENVYLTTQLGLEVYSFEDISKWRSKKK